MIQKALFGAGCFWGVEEHFRTINGVTKTEVGYSGSHTKNPTYESVCYENTDQLFIIIMIRKKILQIIQKTDIRNVFKTISSLKSLM